MAEVLPANYLALTLGVRLQIKVFWPDRDARRRLRGDSLAAPHRPRLRRYAGAQFAPDGARRLRRILRDRPVDFENRVGGFDVPYFLVHWAGEHADPRNRAGRDAGDGHGGFDFCDPHVR